MIATLAEIKTLMRITGTDYDAYITAMIPIVEQWIFDYCNNYFTVGDPYTSNTFAFVDSDPDTITDSDEDFDDYFKDGFYIYVSDSAYNDKHYEIDTVAAGTLTLISDDSLFAEAEDEDREITIQRAVFPASLKLAMAATVKFHIKSTSNSDDDKTITNKKLGDYQVQYQSSTGTADLPGNVKSMLNQYRIVRFI